MLSVPLVAVLAPMGGDDILRISGQSWLAMLPGAATALLLHGVTGVIGRVSACMPLTCGFRRRFGGWRCWRCGVGFLLLGGAPVARVGVGRGGGAAA